MIVAGATGALLLSGEAVATAAGPAPSPTATTHARAGAAPAARASALRVGTFNIDVGVPLDTWTRTIQSFLPRVDVGGLQEVAGRDKAAALRSMPGFNSYVSHRFKQNPVFWNTSVFSLVKGRSPRIAKGRTVEGRSGGSMYERPTLATVARLRSKATGRTVSVVSVHLLQGSVDNGKKVPGRSRRFAMYQEQVRNLGKVMAKERKWADGPVWLVGDFNDNYMAEKKHHRRKLAYATLHRRGLVSSWQAVQGKLRPGQGSGTRSGSYLDQIWSNRKAGSVAVLRDQVFRVGQHYPVVSTYRMP